MPRALIILDFDRTLFSPDFYDEFIDLMAKNGLSSDAATKLKNAIADESQSIELLSEVNAAGISEPKAKSLAIAHLGHDRFLYPDVMPFIERNSDHRIVILTTAAAISWQSFKLDLCPALSRFKRIIVDANKGQHILDHLRREGETIGLTDLPFEMFNTLHLVDDRAEPLETLVGQKHVTLWHIERPDSKYKGGADSAQVHEVTSLNEVSLDES